MEFIVAKQEEYEDIYAAMEENFIASEIRDKRGFFAALNEEGYFLYDIVDGGEKVGFTGCWRLSFGMFLEHFVVYEKYRNLGLGGRAIEAFKERFPPVVLECERPFGELEARRLGFYKRHGFFVADEKYLQPPYRLGGDPVPLYLLSSNEKIPEIRAWVGEIYKKVYKQK